MLCQHYKTTAIHSLEYGDSYTYSRILGCHKTVILNHNTAADSWKVFGIHVHVCVCHGFKLSDIPK